MSLEHLLSAGRQFIIFGSCTIIFPKCPLLQTLEGIMRILLVLIL